MKIRALFPADGRDLRLDLLRGIANWAIFLNHIPNNAVNWITTRNYGFSDGAELFVFISGYTAAFVYGRIMRDHGFVIGATRLAKRVWQLYVAHVMLLVIYIAAIVFVASRFQYNDLLHEFNIANLTQYPLRTLIEGLQLRFKPYNLDVLPLYIVLMAVFPLVLWVMLRRPGLTILGSLIVYFAARHYGWNLAGYPEGGWFFNPFCWQLMFCLGAWAALGGGFKLRPFINSQWLAYFGFAYLAFALIMTLAATFEWLGSLIPKWLFDSFNPNDKTNLAPYRALHFVVIALLVARFLPKDWEGLHWRCFDPLIKCGQQSLPVFCISIFLSFVAYVLVAISFGTLLIQVLVSAAGLAILCGVAYYSDWWKRTNKMIKRKRAAERVPKT